MALTIDIRGASRVRRGLWAGGAVVLVVLWIEILVTAASLLELNTRSEVFLVLGTLLPLAQIATLGVARGVLVRVSRSPWRAHLFLIFAVAYLMMAAATAEEPMLAVYLLVVGAALAWPSRKALRALNTVAEATRSVSDPTFLHRWLYGSQSSLRRQPRPPRAWLRSLPWFTLAVATMLLLTALAILSELGWIRTGLAGLIMPFVLLAAYFFNRGRRHVKLRAKEVRATDLRPPVLILRSFKDDQLQIESRLLKRLRLVSKPTLEEVLAAESASVGPCITVGEPHEKLPPLGASREYLRGGDWRTAVTRLIEEAAVIIFILGETQNVLWEFETAIEKRGVEVIMTVVPPIPKAEELNRRWKRFLEAGSPFLRPYLPDEPEQSVVGFGFREGRPILLAGAGRSRWDYVLALRLFLLLHERRLGATERIEQFLSEQAPAPFHMLRP